LERLNHPSRSTPWKYFTGVYRLNLKAADASPMPPYSADRLAQLKKEYEFAAKEPSNLRSGYVRAA
jgi:hypothetical protein